MGYNSLVSSSRTPACDAAANRWTKSAWQRLRGGGRRWRFEQFRLLRPLHSFSGREPGSRETCPGSRGLYGDAPGDPGSRARRLARDIRKAKSTFAGWMLTNHGCRSCASGWSRATPRHGKKPRSFSPSKERHLLANPLLDFDRLLVVKRKPMGDARRPKGNGFGLGEFLGLPRQSSWQQDTIPKRDGWENEIAVLSAIRRGGELNTLFRPAQAEVGRRHRTGLRCEAAPLLDAGRQAALAGVRDRRRRRRSASSHARRTARHPQLRRLLLARRRDRLCLDGPACRACRAMRRSTWP